MWKLVLGSFVVLLASCDCGGGGERDDGALTITSVEPGSGPVSGGTEVQIRGRGFRQDLGISFGSRPAASLEVLSGSLALATTPPGETAGLVDVTALEEGEEATLPDAFEYVAGPRVDSVEPAFGTVTGGTHVLVHGAGFDEGARVFFGSGEAQDPEVVDGETIACRTPPGAPGFVDVTVENPDSQRGVGEDAYEYRDGLRCGVVETTPAFGAVEVPVVATLQVRWSESVDAASAIGAVALRTLAGEPVEITVEEDGPTAVVVRPRHPLRFWGAYALVVDEGVTAASGAQCDPAAVAFSTVVPATGPRELRPAAAHGLAHVGDYVVVASPSYRGLQVWDVSTPFAPVLTSEVATEVGPQSLVAASGRLYAPAGYDGTLIFDVSDPSAPTLLGRAGSPGFAADAAPFEQGGVPYLAIADGAEGVRLLDVSDAEAARDMGTVDPSGARAADVRAVFVDGDLLAVANGDQGFALVSLEDVGAPQTHAVVPTLRMVTDVAIDGDVLYVAEGYAGIVSYDISDPTNPVLVDSVLDQCQFSCVDNITSLALDGATLYGAAGRPGAYRVSLDGVGGMDVDVRWLTAGNAYQVLPSPDAVFVGEEGGLAVFTPGAADGAAPDFFDASGHGMVRDVLADGALLYAAASTRGLQLFSLDDPGSPAYLDRRDSPGSLAADISAFSLTATGTVLILGDGRAGLTLYDLSDPTRPEEVSNMPARDRIAGMAASGSIVFACDDNGGVVVADLSDPAQPEELAYLLYEDISPADQCYDLLLVGEHLFMASRQYLSVLDASDPAQLHLLGQFSLRAQDAVTRLAMTGTVLLATTVVADYEARFGRTHRLQVFDLSDPEQPERLWVSDDLGGGTDVAAAGEIGFVAGNDRGVYVFDLSDPQAPFLEGVVETPADATSLSLGPEHVYVAGAEGGVLAIETGPLPVP